MVAPQASEAVSQWAQEGRIELVVKTFDPADLNDVFLVIVATSSREGKRKRIRRSPSRKILCNVVDDPEHCDFYYPSVVRRGKLQLAI